MRTRGWGQRRGARGAAAVEYAVVAVLLSVAAIAAMSWVTPSLLGRFEAAYCTEAACGPTQNPNGEATTDPTPDAGPPAGGSGGEPPVSSPPATSPTRSPSPTPSACKTPVDPRALPPGCVVPTPITPPDGGSK